MKETILKFLADLEATVQYDDVEGVSTFPSGGQCCIGTDGAIEVVRYFGGVVMGFLHEDNPFALIAEKCGGHDFAIVEGRWLVDYWAHYVDDTLPCPVLDLKDRDDAEMVALYGDRAKWSEVPVNSGK